MRYALLFVTGLVLTACSPPAPPPVVDTATPSVLGQDVPVPSGAKLVDAQLPKYFVPFRTIQDVQAFYLQRIPEAGWIMDKRASTLVERPELGVGFRSVGGCRTDGSFVSANFQAQDNGVSLGLVKSRDAQTVNVASVLSGRPQLNTSQPCPS